MALSDIITLTITNQTVAVTKDGFGVPLVLSANAVFADAIRWYTGTAGLVTDGFTSTSPEYKAAAAAFAQNPRPKKVGIGKLSAKPTLRWAITPVVANNTAYKMTVNGSPVVYTSDANATLTEIITGLKGAIDALALPITTSDQTTYLRAVENAAGAWHQVKVEDPSKLAIAMDHADPGVAADLDALKLASSEWYALINPYNSAAMTTAIAAWTEANKKLFIATSQDTGIISAGSSDIASTLKTAGYARTAVLYHPDNASFAGAAWLGKLLPYEPGTETWKFKTLAGVAGVDLTPTQYAYAVAKNANVYYPVGGRYITSEGKTASGEFIDITRGADWLETELLTNVFSVLANMKKVPYTNQGVALIEGAVRAALQLGVQRTLLRDNPEPSVTVPQVADVSVNDRANRLLPDVAFSAQYAGAIHKLTIAGTISV